MSLFPPFSSSPGGPLLVVIILCLLCPRQTRRPPTHTGCRRNTVLPLALASPSSLGWDAIHPPRRVVIVAIVLQSPPSPIPGICLTQTPDTSVDVFIVAIILDVTLSLLSLPPAELRCPRGGMWSTLLVLVVVADEFFSWELLFVRLVPWCQSPQKDQWSHNLVHLFESRIIFLQSFFTGTVFENNLCLQKKTIWYPIT